MTWTSALSAFIIVIASACFAESSEVREYCQFESFNATCAQGQIILMTSALSGRMHHGRCVRKDFGHIGCVMDVLHLFDDKCSGRLHCVIRVSSLRETPNVTPCPADLTFYLEAGFECVNVNSIHDGVCGSSTPLIVQNTHGYITPFSVGTLNYLSCNVLIKTKPGQQINVTLFNFNNPTSWENRQAVCPVYISAHDVETTTLNLCTFDRRHSGLFVSKGNSVQLTFSSQGFSQDLSRLLLHYQVIGCPDVIPPPDAWVHRDVDQATVRCNFSEETWYLTCQADSTWLGTVGNCSSGNPQKDPRNGPRNGEHFPYGVLIAVSIGVILGIMIGMVMLTFVFTCRR